MLQVLEIVLFDVISVEIRSEFGIVFACFLIHKPNLKCIATPIPKIGHFVLLRRQPGYVVLCKVYDGSF